MKYEIYWILLTTYIIALFIQTYYLYTNYVNVVELYIIITFNAFLSCILFIERPIAFKKKEISEYVTYGSSMQDAMYGRKYRYDILVDKKKQDNELI